MENIFKQLGIDHIFSAPIKLMENQKYSTNILNQLLRNCENDPDNWDKYINQVLASYHVTAHLATAETPFFLIYGRDPNLPLHQLLEPMQQLLGDPDSGHLDLESHCLALSIAKKTLDENRFKHTQKTTDHIPPYFNIVNRVYLKNKQPG